MTILSGIRKDCGCSIKLNHGLNQRLLFSLFKFFLDWIENSALKFRLIKCLRFKILHDVQGYVPATSQICKVLGMYDFEWGNCTPWCAITATVFFGVIYLCSCGILQLQQKAAKIAMKVPFIHRKPLILKK